MSKIEPQSVGFEYLRTHKCENCATSVYSGETVAGGKAWLRRDNHKAICPLQKERDSLTMGKVNGSIHPMPVQVMQ